MSDETVVPPVIPVVFIDNPHAPEVFASDLAGIWVRNGNVHLTFESARINHEKTPGPVNRVVIARLVLPISAAQGLAASLYDFLKQQGYDPVPVPDKSQIQ